MMELHNLPWQPQQKCQACSNMSRDGCSNAQRQPAPTFRQPTVAVLYQSLAIRHSLPLHGCKLSDDSASPGRGSQMNPVSAWLQAPAQPPASAAVPPAPASRAAPLPQGPPRPPPAAQPRQQPPPQPQQQPQVLTSHRSRGAATPHPAGRLADATPSTAAPPGTAPPAAMPGQSAPSAPEKGRPLAARPGGGTQTSGADVAAAAPASAGIPFRQQPGPVRRGSSAELWQDLLPTDGEQRAGEPAVSSSLLVCRCG